MVGRRRRGRGRDRDSSEDDEQEDGEAGGGGGEGDSLDGAGAKSIANSVWVYAWSQVCAFWGGDIGRGSRGFLGPVHL